MVAKLAGLPNSPEHLEVIRRALLETETGMPGMCMLNQTNLPHGTVSPSVAKGFLSSQLLNGWAAGLHEAARTGDLQKLSSLLDNGGDVNGSDASGKNALRDQRDIRRLLALWGALFDGVPPQNELRPFSQLGNCLRAAFSDPKNAKGVSAETRTDWETLHANNPQLYGELARLSPELHRQEIAYFGFYPDVHWGKKLGLFSPRPVGFLGHLWHFTSLAAKNLVAWFVGFFRPEPQIVAFRRDALRAFQRQGERFSTGAELSQAVEHYLAEHYDITPVVWEQAGKEIEAYTAKIEKGDYEKYKRIYSSADLRETELPGDSAVSCPGASYPAPLRQLSRVTTSEVTAPSVVTEGQKASQVTRNGVA